MQQPNESVQIIEDFLTSDQCAYLIQTFEGKLVPSLVVHDGMQATQHASRTSSTYFLPNSDPVVTACRQKAAAFLGIPVDHLESLQLLRYKKGERYVYHHDYLAGNPKNQRVHTIIVYLNDLVEEDGGATSFFHYKMRVTPKKGRGAWFRNTREDGSLINESLHAGEEIKTDAVKYALNIWSRQYPYC
jgi:prolyl 4-hydroxylase